MTTTIIAPTLEIRSASLKGIPTFGCAQCGRREQGSTVRIEIYAALGISPEQIAHTVESHQISNSAMPLGWSSHEDGHRCSSCTSRRSHAPRDTAGQMLDIGQAEAIDRMNRPDSMDFR